MLALTGPLGAGKTVFVQGLAAGFGVEKKVTSPSYVLMREYEVGKWPMANSKWLKGKLYHVDFYRLDDAVEEVEALGLSEIWESGGDIVVIEWAEKAREKLPSKTRWIEFFYKSEGERRIVMKDFDL